jgi:glycosyltransferase involved in cell wall biosynthesis
MDSNKVQMKISLCLTNYNRTTLLYEAFNQVINDRRISEIIISDDCSNPEVWQSLQWQYNGIDKVKLHRNEKNLDCYFNKRKAIELANNEWVIIFDSDNIIDRKYLDRIENLWSSGLNVTTAYAPDFAKPHFSFKQISGTLINKQNVSSLVTFGNTATMLNAMNYFVNREQYLKVFDHYTDPVTSDSIYQNYRWLDAGNSIYVVPDLEYQHRVHEGSHYQNNVKRTPRGFHEEIINRLKAMR